jgi:ribosomal protein S18 acetylase RimI-like enzyme
MGLSSWRMSLSERSRVLDRSDYAELARIHSSCINLGFLSSLGHGFLSLLYEAIDADDNSHLILEKKEGSVIGFIAGGRGMKSIYRKLLIRLPRVFIALFPAMLNPRKLWKIIELLCFAKKQKPVSSTLEAELFSIAVIDSARGSGLAQKLYNSLGERFFQDGESAFCMVVGENLSQAHRFYNKMGAVPFAQVSVHKGQSSTLYRQDLPID